MPVTLFSTSSNICQKGLVGEWLYHAFPEWGHGQSREVEGQRKAEPDSRQRLRHGGSKTVETPGACALPTQPLSQVHPRELTKCCACLAADTRKNKARQEKHGGKAQGHILVRKEEQSSINGSAWFHLHQSQENISRYPQQVTPKPQQATKCQRQVFVMLVMYVLVRSESWRKKVKTYLVIHTWLQQMSICPIKTRK